MKTTIQGMILLTTMTMIMVLTLLVLSLMQGVLLYVKQSSQQILKHDELLQLENAAQKIMDLRSDECVVKETNPNQLIEQLKRGACTFNDNKRVFYYLISELGDFPCIKIGKQGTHHRLITLSFTETPNVILQLRLASPAQEIICNPLEIRSIQRGVISWRYLD
jgi:Tfp pilus assembly protein PilX